MDCSLLAYGNKETRHLGSAFTAGQRKAQRMEQFAALLAGQLLQLRGKRPPGFVGPVDPLSNGSRVADQQPLVMAEFRRVDIAVKHPEPVGEVGQTLKVWPKQKPIFFRRFRGQAISYRGEIELVKEPGVHQLNLERVEMRRRPAEMGEIETGREIIQAGNRLDRLRGTDPRQYREHRHWLDTFRSDVLRAVRP